MEKSSPHLGSESFPRRAGEQSLPRTVSHSWADFIISVVSSPQLCYKGFQCIFPEAVEGISHCCVTGMAAHSHGTIKKLLPPQHGNHLSSAQVLLEHSFGIKHTAARRSPERNPVPLAGRRRAATELERRCPRGPRSAQPAAAAAPLHEIVENSFSSSSWLSVLKARFFLTLMLMDRTSSLKKAASLCCSE